MLTATNEVRPPLLKDREKKLPARRHRASLTSRSGGVDFVRASHSVHSYIGFITAPGIFSEPVYRNRLKPAIGTVVAASPLLQLTSPLPTKDSFDLRLCCLFDSHSRYSSVRQCAFLPLCLISSPRRALPPQRSCRARIRALSIISITQLTTTSPSPDFLCPFSSN